MISAQVAHNFPDGWMIWGLDVTRGCGDVEIYCNRVTVPRLSSIFSALSSIAQNKN